MARKLGRETKAIPFPKVNIRPSLLALISLTGFSIVIASAIGSRIEWVPTDLQFGLMQMLPLSYYFGISLMTVALVLGWWKNNESVFFLQTTLLYISIWGATSLFEAYPSVWDSYLHYNAALTIVRDGHFATDFSYSYQNNYPGIFIFTASYVVYGNPDALLFLKLWPLFSSFITVLALYLLVRTYIKTIDYRLALLLALIGNVWVQLLFNPQSLGLVLGALVFVFMERGGRAWTGLGFLAFTFLVVTHPTTTFIVIVGLLLREIFVFAHWSAKRIRKYSFLEVSWPVYLFILVWVGWLFTSARVFLNNVVSDIVARLEYLLRVTEVVRGTVSSRTLENFWTIAPMIRLGTFAIFAFLAFTAILLYLPSKRKNIRIPLAPIAVCLLSIIIIPLDLILFNSMLYDRGLLFLMVFSPIVIVCGIAAVRLVARRPWLKGMVVSIAIISVMFCASTIYYSETMYVVSDRSIRVSEYLGLNVTSGGEVIGGFTPYMVWVEGKEQTYSNQRYYWYYPETLGNLTRVFSDVTLVFDRTSYVWMAQYGDYGYSFYYAQRENNSRVYANGACEVIIGWIGAP